MAQPSDPAASTSAPGRSQGSSYRRRWWCRTPSRRAPVRSRAVELRGNFAEQSRDIAGEGAPNLDVKRSVAGAPENDVGLRQYGAGAHTHGEFAEIEIQRAGAAQNSRRMRAAHFECKLPVTDIDQGVGQL